MKRALVLLLVAIALVARQQAPSSWEVAKPIVDKWRDEYSNAGRTNEARDRILSEIRQLLAEHTSDIWAYEAAALGYNNLNRNDQALEVIRAYLRRFPEGSTLDNRVEFFFGNWGSVADLESLPKRWHQRARYWEMLFRAYERANAAPELLKHAGEEALARIPRGQDPGGNKRNWIAETWLANGVDPRSAERVAREAVAIAEIGEGPSLSTDSAPKRKILDRLIIRNINRSALGWALYQQRRFPEALAELQQAVKIRERDWIGARAIYYRLGQTLEKLNHPEEALETYYKELAWGAYPETTEAALADLYRRLHGSLDGFETAKRTQVNELVAKGAEDASDLVRETDEDLGHFDLPDAQGQPIDLNSYRGKVVIIEFWATWCTPCLTSMEQTNLIQQRLGDKVVVIAPTIDPEETRPRAIEYLKQKNYDFILAFDDERRRALRLPYIPARVILDQSGRMRFQEFGSTQASAALFEKKVRELASKEGPK